MGEEKEIRLEERDVQQPLMESLSLLAQRGVSTALTQRLLEHSSSQLTNDAYTNVGPVLGQAVQYRLLPVL
jgi:hypothetical protein